MPHKEHLQKKRRVEAEESATKEDYDNIFHADDDQRSSYLLPTGHPDTPNGHYESLNEHFDMSTGHSNAQVNSHRLDNRMNFKTATTDISKGKQRLRPT